jgi:hypothetical protein
MKLAVAPKGLWRAKAEEEGFEPPVHGKADNGFQDRRIRPLCHSSSGRKSSFFFALSGIEP